MACYHPLPAWRSRTLTAQRTFGVTFKLRDAWSSHPVEISCGQCIGCRLDRARQWAIRCMHEAQLHDSNYFVTLTYDDDQLPPGGSLRPQDFVLFMKRLRQHTGGGIRFFQCGEYGDNFQRPHHHALLFGLQLHDLTPVPRAPGLVPLFRSEQLDHLWSHGYTTTGHVTYESAGYVASYSLKKITGAAAELHYAGRVPEYATMSRRPGIGSNWIHRFKGDVYPDDRVVLRGGQAIRPPRYYDAQLPEPQLRRITARRRAAKRRTPRQLINAEANTTARRSLKAARNYEENGP